MIASPWRRANPSGYTPRNAADPIHLKDDGWYFWDETWCDEHGPFGSHEECVECLHSYCKVNGLL